MSNIAYIANPKSIHDCKWINLFAINHNVIIICSELDRTSAYLKDKIKVYPILPEFPYKNFIKRNKVLSLLKEIVKEEEIDIIHSMYAFPHAFWVNLIHFKNHIITTRGSDVLVDYKDLYKPTNSFKENLTNKYFIKQFHESFNNAKFITSTSISQQEVISNFLNDTNKLKLIRTGVDVEGFLKTSRKVEKNAEEEVIFSPRSMMPIYNQDIIVRAFNQVLKKYPKIKLVLINDVPNEGYATEIIHLIDELGLKENCIVTNKLSKKEMVEWYVNSDIVVSIPKTDGSPNSVLEAMLAKKSIIIGDYNYDTQLFSNILKLNTNTESELAARIEELIEKQVNTETLEDNFKLVEQLASLEKSIVKVDKLYSEILQQKKSDQIHTLFIAAWYPHKENKTHGNFIKEHAKAVALFAKVSVVFIRFIKSRGIPRTYTNEKMEGNLTEYFITIHSPVRRFDIHDLLIKSAYKKVIKQIEEKQKIDICHINVRDIYTESVLELKKLNFPIVITEHFSHYHTGIYQLSEKEQEIETQKIKKWFSDARIKYVMPVSKQLGDVLINNFGVERLKTITIPNIADKCFFYSKKEPTSLTKIILVANWHEPKNPILFLEALTKIPAELLTSIEIDWIGDGTQMKAVKSFIQKKMSILKINFWGTKNKTFIAEKFREAAFFVHPTDAENLPTVIIESLCCGTPVLTHNVNGIPELINSSNGIMCKAKDIDNFSENFIKMLQQYSSFDNLKISEEAQSEYYVEPISSQLKDIYIKVLDQNV